MLILFQNAYQSDELLLEYEYLFLPSKILHPFFLVISKNLESCNPGSFQGIAIEKAMCHFSIVDFYEGHHNLASANQMQDFTSIKTHLLASANQMQDFTSIRTHLLASANQIQDFTSIRTHLLASANQMQDFTSIRTHLLASANKIQDCTCIIKHY